MQKVSELQQYFPTDWSGLTTKNHLGSIFQIEPQWASKLVTLMYATNVGYNFGTWLDANASVRTLESDDEFRWMLQGSSDKNIPLVVARINGTAITSTSQCGLGHTQFELVFSEMYFSDTDVIIGEKNDLYQMRIVDDPTMDGGNYVYVVELVTGDETLFVPYDELIAGKRFSREWSLAPQTLSDRGGKVNYTSPFAMKNIFSFIRMQDTRPGNMKSRPVAFSWVDPKTKKQMTTWTQYADWEFDRQFMMQKDKLVVFSKINQKSDGTFANMDKNGFVVEQGSGLIEQIESSNTSYYSHFDIEAFTDRIMDLSDNAKGFGNVRRMAVKTGKWGAIQFHKELERFSKLWTPANDASRIYSTSSGKMGYKGVFMEYQGPDGTLLDIVVDPMYDDKVRNKVTHSSGKGVVQSYIYDIFDLSLVDGKSNIVKVIPGGDSEIMGYEPGLRNPFTASLERNLMSNPKDGWTIHRAFMGGAQVTDPTRCMRYMPNEIV